MHIILILKCISLSAQKPLFCNTYMKSSIFIAILFTHILRCRSLSSPPEGLITLLFVTITVSCWLIMTHAPQSTDSTLCSAGLYLFIVLLFPLWHILFLNLLFMITPIPNYLNNPSSSLDLCSIGYCVSRKYHKVKKCTIVS